MPTNPAAIPSEAGSPEPLRRTPRGSPRTGSPLPHRFPFHRIAHEGVVLVVAVPLVLHRQDRYAGTINDQEIQTLAVDRAERKVAGFLRSGRRPCPDDLPEAGLGHHATAAAGFPHDFLEDAENPVFRPVEKAAGLELDSGDVLHLLLRVAKARMAQTRERRPVTVPASPPASESVVSSESAACLAASPGREPPESPTTRSRPLPKVAPSACRSCPTDLQVDFDRAVVPAQGRVGRVRK